MSFIFNKKSLNSTKPNNIGYMINITLQQLITSQWMEIKYYAKLYHGYYITLCYFCNTC
ncbi:hypothetical protein YE105_C1051 [Yersinia enterocolitica subsp. palearctica 105.5R(r)]|nr:hypothetical protein YE105_C1051 [Yersinia enterocolitica subsp. palearctica 105.5R(r)]